MEIAWEGRPCGPKGCKGRKGLLLSSKHKWKSWKYLFPAPHPHFQRESLQTQISKLATFHLAKTHISELEIFVSPKPKYQSWKRISLKTTFENSKDLFSPQTQITKWEVFGCLAVLPKLRFQCFVFESPNFNDGNMSCLFKTRFSKFNLFVAGARPKFQS